MKKNYEFAASHSPASDSLGETGEPLYEVGEDKNGEVTFNGYNRAQIVDNCIPGLNLYQMVCKKRKIFTGDEILTKKIFDEIKKLITCPICLDIVKEPVNVKTCLHKFCSECIEKYNRQHKKLCPSCRAPIGSRRILRRDDKITQIIKKLIKDYTVYDELQVKEFEQNKDSLNFQAKIKQVHNNANFPEHSNHAALNITGKRRTHPRINIGERIDGRKRIKIGENDTSEEKFLQIPEKENEIQFKIAADPLNPDCVDLPRSKLRTVPNITILQLVKFIAFKIELQSTEVHRIKFFIMVNDYAKKVKLENEDKLLDIDSMHWQNGRDKILYYRIEKT